jgi:hypothetical protein
VEKPGSRGWYQDQSTVLVAGTNGQLQVATQGTGIKDRNAPRFAGDESRVAKLLREAQAFTYARTDSWGRPEDLEKYKVGDCADKSFWLASKLQEAGFTSARVVCGIRDGAKEGHAWVEVKVNGQDMLLETTSTDAPLPLWQAKLEYYLRYPPYAAFDRSGARRLR